MDNKTVGGEGMNFTEKKSTVRKLVELCPQGHKSNKKCPLRNVRRLTPANQAHYLNGLDEAQLDHIITFHSNCLELSAVLSPNDTSSSKFSTKDVRNTH